MLEDILFRLEVQLRRSWRKHLFAGIEVGFTVIAVLLLEHWILFSIDLIYSFQDNFYGKNVYLLVLKSGLRHLPFYFWNIGSYLRRLEVPFPWYGWNRLFSDLKSGLRHSQLYFWRLEFILRRLEVCLRRYVRKRLWNRICVIHCSVFRTLELILRLLEVRLPRHRRKRLFTGFEIGLTALAVLFLEYWRLFYVDWR